MPVPPKRCQGMPYKQSYSFVLAAVYLVAVLRESFSCIRQVKTILHRRSAFAHAEHELSAALHEGWACVRQVCCGQICGALIDGRLGGKGQGWAAG